jgi:hypothetical protein
MTPAGIATDPRPGGPAAKRQPSPEGLGNKSQENSSAVGVALYVMREQLDSGMSNVSGLVITAITPHGSVALPKAALPARKS